MTLPAITQTARGVVSVPEQAVEVLTAKQWKLYRYDPTGPDGSYTYMLCDANEKILAMAEHHDHDTALLLVIEPILPK